MSSSSRGNLPVPPGPLHRSADADERLRRWLQALVETPGLTAIKDVEEARTALLEDSLRGLDRVQAFAGPIIDVGSGGGVPGIPIAASLPDREVVLLEATGRKCDFLRVWAPPNTRVIEGRAEE
ncbi:MAG: RsmG family class I SAM-dependent methyltransferase, partial [Gaiellaceae bacterium]